MSQGGTNVPISPEPYCSTRTLFLSTSAIVGWRAKLAVTPSKRFGFASITPSTGTMVTANYFRSMYPA